MKKINEVVVLWVLLALSAAAICFSGFTLTYGWFGYGSVEEIEVTVSHGFDSDVVTDPLDVNQASLDQLTKIPGMTTTLAREIVLYRQFNGPFTDYNDLLQVEGCTREVLVTIMPYITIQ